MYAFDVIVCRSRATLYETFGLDIPTLKTATIPFHGMKVIAYEKLKSIILRQNKFNSL